MQKILYVHAIVGSIWYVHVFTVLNGVMTIENIQGEKRRIKAIVKDYTQVAQVLVPVMKNDDLSGVYELK